MVHRSTFLAFLFALCCLWMFIPQPVSAQQATATLEPPTPAGTSLSVIATPASVGVFAPENGAILSGVVEISGAVLSAWSLSFSYADDPTSTWFSLAQSGEPVSAGILATWDTTTLTDGFYVLRLHVSSADAAQDFKVNVCIQNDAPIETATPSPTLTVTPTLTPAVLSTAPNASDATLTVALTPSPSPTLSGPLPPNPATLNQQDILMQLGKGALAVAVFFAFGGLVLKVRRR
jgi:hypothetical protein